MISRLATVTLPPMAITTPARTAERKLAIIVTRRTNRDLKMPLRLMLGEANLNLGSDEETKVLGAVLS